MSSLLFYRNCSKSFLRNEINYNFKTLFSKQRKNFSDLSQKSEIPKGPKDQKFFSNRNIAIFGIASGTILTTYFIGKKFSSKPAIVIEKKEEEIQQITDLPEEIEFLIIGGGSTAFAALRTIRANNPKSKVIVVSNESYNPYMRPPLSKELWFADEKLKKELKYKQWNDKERSIFYAHDEFYFDLKQLKESETGGVTVIKNHKVSKIEPYDQYVILDNGQTLKYGKCLIATGSKSVKSSIEKNAPSQVKERILSFKTIDDFNKVSNIVDSKKSIALIGSEFLSSELACALTRQETKDNIIQVLENKGNLNTVLPSYLSEWTTKCLKEDGINIIPTAKVISTEFKNDKVIINLSDGQQLKTDYLIIDNKGTPNTDLAEDSGLEICSQNGGFLVNSELQARTNLWVAGDAASFYDEKLGRRQSSHHDNSLVTGRLAGENMSGGHKIFWHQPIVWSDLGPRIGFEAIGIVDSTLPTISVFKKSEQNDDKDLKIKLPEDSDKYEKGVVFYIKEGIVVGMLLWNVFNKTHLARRIINETKSYENLEELAKLFELYKNDFEDEE